MGVSTTAFKKQIILPESSSDRKKETMVVNVQMSMQVVR